MNNTMLDKLITRDTLKNLAGAATFQLSDTGDVPKER
jgi:hypothetical protein